MNDEGNTGLITFVGCGKLHQLLFNVGTSVFPPKNPYVLHLSVGRQRSNKSERSFSLKQFVSLIVLYSKFNEASVTRTYMNI